jgi:hypothetical protein
LASAVSVQLAAVPEPTVTVVGLVSAVKGVGQMAGRVVVALPVRVALESSALCGLSAAT